MYTMTFLPLPGFLGRKDWPHCFPYRRHHCRWNIQLDHHPRQNHHCNSPQDRRPPWPRCEEGGERWEWRSDSWPVFQWDCRCWRSQSWWRTAPYLANPTAALGVHKYQRERVGGKYKVTRYKVENYCGTLQLWAQETWIPHQRDERDECGDSQKSVSAGRTVGGIWVGGGGHRERRREISSSRVTPGQWLSSCGHKEPTQSENPTEHKLEGFFTQLFEVWCLIHVTLDSGLILRDLITATDDSDDVGDV